MTNCVVFYDNSGTPETRTHNNVNELTARDGTNLTYDDNGNLADDGTCTFAYDALNRLIKVTRKSDSAVMAEYAYDALGRRIWRKSDEDQSGSQETELYYIHDGQREIEERVYSDEDLKRDYVYGNYIDEPIFGRSDNNDDNDFADSKEQFYYCHNNLYNVTVLLDTSGNIIESYAYQPYGKPIIYTSDGGDGDWFDGDETTGSLTCSYYLFTGRRYDPENGLYFYRSRYYSPELGRFINRDLIGYWSGMNLYTYCANNPINLIDPTGLKVDIVFEPCRPWGEIGTIEWEEELIETATVYVKSDWNASTKRCTGTYESYDKVKAPERECIYVGWKATGKIVQYWTRPFDILTRGWYTCSAEECEEKAKAKITLKPPPLNVYKPLP